MVVLPTPSSAHASAMPSAMGACGVIIFLTSSVHREIPASTSAFTDAWGGDDTPLSAKRSTTIQGFSRRFFVLDLERRYLDRFVFRWALNFPTMCCMARP